MPADSATPVRTFTPWLTRGLAVVNVAVFAAMALAGLDVLHPEPLAYIDWGSNFAPLTAAGEWWRLGTSAFLHFGPLHLLFNCWALWVIGPPVERLFGRGRFLVIYVVAGLAGGLASVAWNPLVNSAGASGAIFGLIGAELAFFTRGGHRVPAGVIRAQRNGLLGFIAYSVIFGFIVPGIDNAAHLGGLATGFGLGWLLARPAGAPASPSRDRAGLLAATLLAAGLAVAGAQLARYSAAHHAAEQAYLLEWRQVVQAEPDIVARMNEVMSAARDGRLGDRQVVSWLEGRGIPFYRDAARRLAQRTLPRGSPLADDQQRALDFVRARAAGLELLAAGIRENDRAKLEQAIGQLSPPAGGHSDARDP